MHTNVEFKVGQKFAVQINAETYLPVTVRRIKYGDKTPSELVVEAEDGVRYLVHLHASNYEFVLCNVIVTEFVAQR